MPTGIICNCQMMISMVAYFEWMQMLLVDDQNKIPGWPGDIDNNAMISTSNPETNASKICP